MVLYKLQFYQTQQSQQKLIDLIPDIQQLYNNRQMSQQNNPKLLSDLITSMSQNRSKESVLNELLKVDQQLAQIYGQNINPHTFTSELFISTNLSNKLTETPNNSICRQTTAVSLGIPKANSLTDSLLRSTLGCQQKLAKSYLQIIDTTEQTEQQEKQKRIQEAKAKFAQNNNYKDLYANSRPLIREKNDRKDYVSSRSYPVVDNEHDSYLKTQLIYLQKPKVGSKKVSEKQYYDKHMDSVTRKIKEIGGMQDTIGCMQESLSKYEIRNFKKRSMFNSGYNNNDSFNPYRATSREHGEKRKNSCGNSWMDRSRVIRQQMMTKFDIE